LIKKILYFFAFTRDRLGKLRSLLFWFTINPGEYWGIRFIALHNSNGIPDYGRGTIMAKNVGVLTAGSDSPGLNAAIRSIGRAISSTFGRPIVAFHDGFKGLVEDETVTMTSPAFSGILTSSGTVLGTSRDLPDRMLVDGKIVDRTDEAIETYHRHQLDVWCAWEAVKHRSQPTSSCSAD
jgi:hypothetical protein